MSKEKLKNFSSVITKGTTPTTVGGSFTDKGIIFVKSESIRNTKYLDNSIFEHIDEETDRKLKRSRLQENDLLFSIAGAYLGKVAIVRKIDIPANTNQAVGIVRLNHELVDTDYIYYFFSQKRVTEYINNLSSQSSQPNLNLELLGDLEFEYRDLKEQKKISSILSIIDSKIEINNKINTDLEMMAKTVYDYWFVQFDFPDENGQPYKSSGGEMVWSEILKKEIPKGWGALRISSIFEFEKGIEPGSDEYSVKPLNDNFVKFFRVGDIDGNSAVFVDATKNNYKLANTRDVIVTFDGSVGKLGFGLKGAFSGGLRKIYDKSEKFDNALVYCLFNDDRIIATIHKYATGSVLLHASSAIDHLIIPFSEKHYLRFQSIVLPIFNQMVSNKEENEKLAELRDWLLPILMNGQVIVK